MTVSGAAPVVDLCGVVDLDPDRAREVAADVGTVAVPDVREIDPPVDGAVVSVPTRDHLRVGLPLLEAGVAVLVEKPIAASIAEADRMIAAASASGATLAVGHTERHNPAVTAALPLISAPRFIEVHRLASFQPRSLDIDVVFDVMIHDLDVVLSVVGSEPVSIEAVGVPALRERLHREPDGQPHQPGPRSQAAGLSAPRARLGRLCRAAGRDLDGQEGERRAGRDRRRSRRRGERRAARARAG